MKLDWNRERHRTRDRLYDMAPTPYIMPPILSPININSSILEYQLLEIAKKYGFEGNSEGLWNKLLNSAIYYGTINDFPVLGDKNTLYLDTETGILYYFKTTVAQVDPELIARVDAAIVDVSYVEETEEVITSIYIPVRCFPIENLILNN